MTYKPWDARVAAWLVRPFVDSPRIKPNHLTALRLAVGLAGAWCFARGTQPNLAAALIVTSNFLDHTDGELARLGDKGSRLGHCFDLVADALVTVGMFLGIGIGLASTGGARSIVMGVIAGVAVALIFHLRHRIEERHGKTATRQPGAAGFEAEDVLYLLPLVTLTGNLDGFLLAAAMGAPLASMVVALQYLRVMRARAVGAP